MEIKLKELNDIIKDSLPKNNFVLNCEVSSVSNRRGHTYLDFKEDNNKLAGMIFNNPENLNEGDKIKCSGKLSYYAPYGKISLNVNNIISKNGLGNIFKEFIQLKEKLTKEGIFSNKHKKQINGLIKNVNIITSEQGAAIQDIFRNLKNHNSLINVNLIDAPVQGINCDKEITKIINKFKKSNEIIIITRGGGDYQDLNGFNQENMIRSIFKNKNIIISAIGHETDTVLSDLVADYTLPTPSLVAQFLIDHNNNIINSWENEIHNLEQEIYRKLDYQYNKLRDFEIDIKNEESQLDLWVNKLENNIIENIYSQEKLLDDYLNYLNSVGEIKLLNYKEKEFTNLEDIGQIFMDKQFFIRVKDRLFKISGFDVKEKICLNNNEE